MITNPFSRGTHQYTQVPSSDDVSIDMPTAQEAERKATWGWEGKVLTGLAFTAVAGASYFTYAYLSNTNETPATNSAEGFDVTTADPLTHAVSDMMSSAVESVADCMAKYASNTLHGCIDQFVKCYASDPLEAEDLCKNNMGRLASLGLDNSKQ